MAIHPPGGILYGAYLGYFTRSMKGEAQIVLATILPPSKTLVLLLVQEIVAKTIWASPFGDLVKYPPNAPYNIPPGGCIARGLDLIEGALWAWLLVSWLGGDLGGYQVGVRN
jgi:hypothetical protein